MKNVQIICEKYKIYFHAGITKCLICQLNQIGERNVNFKSPKKWGPDMKTIQIARSLYSTTSNTSFLALCQQLNYFILSSVLCYQWGSFLRAFSWNLLKNQVHVKQLSRIGSHFFCRKFSRRQINDVHHLSQGWQRWGCCPQMIGCST